MSSSSSKIPGLQRARSSSSISQPYRLSRLPVRNSTNKNRGKSVGRQDKLSLDRNVTRSSSNLSDRSRLCRQRSGSLSRMTLTTPLGLIQSGRKSPLLSSIRKDTRPIADKRWQYEQIVKVRTFVAEYFSHLDQNNIKSGIPLELFVGLMDSYFKLIDRRINITRENYIEEVPINLKRFRYQATVKPSLMKTVNTPHSWPHVLAILSWLTDIITQLNEPANPTSELATLVEDYSINMYTQWTVNSDDTEDGFALNEFQAQLEVLMPVDEEAINTLDKELKNLQIEIDSYTQRENSKMEKMQALQINIKSINEKCDSYIKENETLEKRVKEQHAKYPTKIMKIDQELNALLKTEEQLKAVVASQPHSFEEKQQLITETKDLQNTLKLKEERQKQQRELVSRFDFQLSDIKQQMQAKAFECNNLISELELIDPKLKNLHIRESGFARSDTEDEIKEALRLLKEAIDTLKQKSEISEKNLEEATEKQTQIDKELLVAKKEEENAAKLEAELNITHAHNLKKDEYETEKLLKEINTYQNKLLALKESKYDILPLQNKLKELKEKKEEHLAFKQDLKDRALDFFNKLDVQIQKNLETYMNVMENITLAMISGQESAIADARDRIKKLKELRIKLESLELPK